MLKRKLQRTWFPSRRPGLAPPPARRRRRRDADRAMETPHPRQPPELVEDAVAEILLRLPPDEPELLFRASLVCKPWLRLVRDPAFLRRYRAFHGAPPLLGHLHRLQVMQGDPTPGFTATTAVPAFPHPASMRRPLDCRHGRVLFHDDGLDLLVWDPVTGDLHAVPDPAIDWLIYTAAVICAVPGCDHLDCHGGPFRVAFVATEDRLDVVQATIYSSETGSWTRPTSLGTRSDGYYVEPRRGILIRDEFYFTIRTGQVWAKLGTAIGKYDLGKDRLSLVNPPLPEECDCLLALMVMKDCSLGLATIENSSLHLWSSKVTEGVAGWGRCRVIELETVMPMAKPCDGACVVGFAEGVDVIFVRTGVGLFAFGLNSGLVRKVEELENCYSVLPYMSFYTPGILMALVLILSCI